MPNFDGNFAALGTEGAACHRDNVPDIQSEEQIILLFVHHIQLGINLNLSGGIGDVSKRGFAMSANRHQATDGSNLSILKSLKMINNISAEMSAFDMSTKWLNTPVAQFGDLVAAAHDFFVSVDQFMFMLFGLFINIDRVTIILAHVFGLPYETALFDT